MAVFRSCNLIAHKCREVISLSTPSNFYVILPAFRGLYGVDYRYENAQPHEKGQVYRSHEQTLLSREEIAAYLRESGLLPHKGA